jgi:transposase
VGVDLDAGQHRRLRHGARMRQPDPGIKEPLADKGYDTDAFRAFLKQQKIRPVIPGKSNRKKRIRHDKSAYKCRNVIERCFGRLKDFRRIATRYDKLAGNFFSALCLVAIVAYWL